MSDDPLNNPLNELGHISLNAKQLSQSTAKLAAVTEQAGNNIQHASEVFAPILAEFTGELVRLRKDIRDGTEAAGRSAWALVYSTIALVLVTLVLALVTVWPAWFPPAAHQGTLPPEKPAAPKSLIPDKPKDSFIPDKPQPKDSFIPDRPANPPSR